MGFITYCMQCMDIKQNNEWETLISFLAWREKERKNTSKGKKGKKIVCVPARVLNSCPPLLSNTIYQRTELFLGIYITKYYKRDRNEF